MKLLSLVVICLHLQKDTFYFGFPWSMYYSKPLYKDYMPPLHSLLQLCLYYLRTVLFVSESINTFILAMFVMYRYHGNTASFQFAWCLPCSL